MELTANVWPVVDDSGLVLRYLMRAYAMEAPDDVIGRTLLALAKTDFLMARAFPIPERFEIATEHGTMPSCVVLADFHEYQAVIIAPGLAELEKGFAKLQGISVDTPNSTPMGLNSIPRFPNEPYLVTTTLVETAAGRLIPQIRIDNPEAIK